MIRKADWYEIDFEAVLNCYVAVGRGLQRATIVVPWFGEILRSVQREMTVENWATEGVKCGQFCQRSDDEPGPSRSTRRVCHRPD